MFRFKTTLATTHRLKALGRGLRRPQFNCFSEVFQPYSENYYTDGDQVLETIIRDEPKDIEYALRHELKVDGPLKEVRNQSRRFQFECSTY